MEFLARPTLPTLPLGTPGVRDVTANETERSIRAFPVSNLEVGLGPEEVLRRSVAGQRKHRRGLNWRCALSTFWEGLSGFNRDPLHGHVPGSVPQDVAGKSKCAVSSLRSWSIRDVRNHCLGKEKQRTRPVPAARRY